MTNHYYWNDGEGGNKLERISRRSAHYHHYVFFTAASIALLRKHVVESDEHGCTDDYISVSKIPHGKKRTFIHGDPVVFTGTRINRVKLQDGDMWVQIRISAKDKVFAYLHLDQDDDAQAIKIVE